MIFISIVLFYISFLHFFRYPYTMSKRYTAPLNLSRARGVLVTPTEKELYESLASYLSLNLGREDKILVTRYLPQLSFLSERKDIFEYDMTDISLRE